MIVGRVPQMSRLGMVVFRHFLSRRLVMIKADDSRVFISDPPASPFLPAPGAQPANAAHHLPAAGLWRV